MNDTVFVLGNGLSRKNIDPNSLPGLVIGCNACYRDFEPNVLCAIDAGMIFNIVEHHSKLDSSTELFYFTHNSWNPIPAEARNNLVLNGSHIRETKNKSKEFVVISGFDDEIQKIINYIIWVPESDIIKNMGENLEGWSTGTSAVYATCRDLNPKKIYLLGFDHDNDKYDNLYANTPQYFKSDRRGWKSTHKGWTNELLKVIRDFPEIEFFWINSSTNFHNQKNLHFIDGDTKWPH